MRIVGNSSLGWLEAAVLWGANIQVFVCGNDNLTQVIRRSYPHTQVPLSHDCRTHKQPNDWDGILLATLSIATQDATMIRDAIQKWRPKVLAVTCPLTISRKEFRNRLAIDPAVYQCIRTTTCSHDVFGGVTTSTWRLTVSTCILELDNVTSGMTAGCYPRTLQTALDDTIGGLNHVVRLEKGSTQSSAQGIACEQVWCTRTKQYQYVHEASALGPDLYGLTEDQRLNIWVKATSVFSQDKVIRRITPFELAAVWDYAGKTRYSEMTPCELNQLTRWRMMSPPGKILTAVTFTLCQSLREHQMSQEPTSAPVISPPARGPGLLNLDPTTYRDQPKDDISNSPIEAQQVQRVKAAVADDAPIDFSYWADPNETTEQARARSILRRFAHKWWLSHITREATTWLSNHGNTKTNRSAVQDCLARAAGSDYWEWHRGSRLFFWRFPDKEHWLEDARDGVPFWHITPPPKGRHFQNIKPETRADELQIRVKVFQLKFRWYLESGFSDLVIPTFPVDKVIAESGERDIRAVWDAKRNGLNATLWAPKFALPTTQDAEDLVVKWLLLPVGHHLDRGSPRQDYTQDDCDFIKSWQFDLDVGQMFHNFTMFWDERHSHGVRFFHTVNDGSVEQYTMFRWCVLNFGCLCSPYLACQGQERIMEMCIGDPSDCTNPFQWEKVWLNLPTALNYDPSFPRVILLKRDGDMATRRVTFVDDIHGSTRAKTRDQVQAPIHHLASKMNYYANQEATRKRRHATLTPGAWNGVLIHCDSPYPVKSTTAAKWKRGVSALQWLWDHFNIQDGITDPIGFIKQTPGWEASVDTSELRRIAGLWVHITEVYTEGRCFLKGLFNAMEAFRGGRDPDGWRLAEIEDDVALLEQMEATKELAGTGYPAMTRVTHELVMHIHALRQLFNGLTPRVVELRPREKHQLRYSVGDASAEGFAMAVQYPSLTIEERDGLWLEEYSAKTSNLREALNIANHMKHDIAMGKHDGCEIWQATDNAVWSAVCTKGMASVRHLFQLLVDIKLLAHEHNVFWKCFHISGDRMIATGVDGLSRGDKDSGITLGYDLRDYLPLDKSAFDQVPSELTNWCKGWMGTDFRRPLQPSEWFTLGQQPGIHVWAPPPAAALIALKEVARARHKRPYHGTHIIFIPRLLYQEEWRKRFEKEVDVWFALSAGGEAWPHMCFEPLMIGIAFPLYRSYPWQIRHERERVVEFGRSLSQMSKSGHLPVRDSLRKLWDQPRTFFGM